MDIAQITGKSNTARDYPLYGIFIVRFPHCDTPKDNCISQRPLGLTHWVASQGGDRTSSWAPLSFLSPTEVLACFKGKLESKVLKAMGFRWTTLIDLEYKASTECGSFLCFWKPLISFSKYVEWSHPPTVQVFSSNFFPLQLLCLFEKLQLTWSWSKMKKA